MLTLRFVLSFCMFLFSFFLFVWCRNVKHYGGDFALECTNHLSVSVCVRIEWRANWCHLGGRWFFTRFLLKNSWFRCCTRPRVSVNRQHKLSCACAHICVHKHTISGILIGRFEIYSNIKSISSEFSAKQVHTSQPYDIKCWIIIDGEKEQTPDEMKSLRMWYVSKLLH